MSADRISLAPCLPLFGGLPFRRAQTPLLPPAIVARRGELQAESFGRLTYYSNASEQRAHDAAPALVLLHGIHLSASAHEMRLLFDAFRDERSVYALDLPGFGSSDRHFRDYTPQLYVQAIEQIIEVAVSETHQAVDVVAVGLSSEFAAQATVRLPARVRSLTLIEPTGFALKRDQGRFERAARRGKALAPVSLVASLRLSQWLFRTLASKRALRHRFQRPGRSSLSDDALRYRYATAHQPGAHYAPLAFLSGVLFPVGNPQSIYTRVHRPTLILHDADSASAFGSLETFVKWREHFRAAQLDDVCLLEARGVENIARELRAFWAAGGERVSSDSTDS